MKARRVLAITVLAAYSVLHTATALFWIEGPLRFCLAFYGIACAVGAVALARPTFWARRYAIGIGIAGLLNCAAFFGYFHDFSHGFGGRCFGVVQLAAFVGLVVALLGKRMRAHYDERAAHWHFDHGSHVVGMHMLAGALSFNVAGIGMLVYYACLDESWTTPQLRAGALMVAAVLSVGSILSARGRILGLFTMMGAGALSLYLGYLAFDHVSDPTYVIHDCGAWQAWQTWGQWETFKSVVGFVPAGLGSLLCFGVFLGPMIRFVRTRA